MRQILYRKYEKNNWHLNEHGNLIFFCKNTYKMLLQLRRLLYYYIDTILTLIKKVFI